ncbi:aminoglycoside phosphotransferase family protein [Streptomyces sp. JV190]|uniref:aminoglycoside phosphotransferase family protein n=1 Tax=Streptomyces sp. JV190 TaxID=3002533 RepID=UPI002E76F87B|nr:aminoglycoside phosphotransferase family protein [Streptomyces sp. JV190]MEE1841583.1 phosphotransferase [Streptomyces sp. JV190]
MSSDASAVVDRGQYQDAVTPWEREDWRADALGWAERGLTAHGLRETGPRRVRLRPWSVLVRFSVAGGDAVWFKANPPASAFEAGLTRALAHWVPGYVLHPLAVEADRGWSLLPDGGTLFREALDAAARTAADPHAWEEPLRQYAGVQRALAPYADEIEQFGVPGARTATLPAVFDRVVAGNTALEPAERAALHALRPRVVEWCEELEGVGIADTLDHSDLHDGQLFAPEPGRFTFFDWGDASVTHPFCSFLVPACAARERFGPEALPRLRDAYLERWTGDGRTTAELRRALSLAWRLGAIGRACSWERLFPGAYGAVGGAGDAAGARWLLELAAEPPL